MVSFHYTVCIVLHWVGLCIGPNLLPRSTSWKARCHYELYMAPLLTATLLWADPPPMESFQRGLIFIIQSVVLHWEGLCVGPILRPWSPSKVVSFSLYSLCSSALRGTFRWADPSPMQSIQRSIFCIILYWEGLCFMLILCPWSRSRRV
jgi:hypothetical protein